MIVVYDGKEYRIRTEDSQLVRDIEKNLPLQLQMRKNGEAEYTGILPFHPVNDARPVTKTVPNAVYYFEDWNVLCLNIEANTIAPWHVNFIGMAEGDGFAELLGKTKGEIIVTVKK